MAIAITGGTIIDATGGKPIEDGVIVIDKGRILAVGGGDTAVPPNAKKIDAKGKYLIPGLMNANVHMSSGATNLERGLRHMHQFEDIITESLQIALKSGFTTVFDTAGLRRPLMAVRDKINAGQTIGSRLFCAGWIVGTDGIFSADHDPRAMQIVSASFMKRMNAMCSENVGRHLMWLPPKQVAEEIRKYIAKGIDFLKYASNEHFGSSAGALINFSPRVQAAIVNEAHSAGLTAQAHTMSGEGLHLAIEAGCDIIQHVNITGPVPIDEETLEVMAKRQVGAVIFPHTKNGMEWIKKIAGEMEWVTLQSAEVNVRNLIRSGAPLLLANDGLIFPPEWKTDPKNSMNQAALPEADNLINLATGHFTWFRAMEEKECPAMQMLQAATRNIAEAYGKDKDLGTLEKGKIADLLILDKNPLQAAENYRSIRTIVKEGVVIDRDALPLNPILTKPDEPAEEEASYIPFIASGPRLPMCPMCM
jgi:imidazolonepropionase-like amidohydrolase